MAWHHGIVSFYQIMCFFINLNGFLSIIHISMIPHIVQVLPDQEYNGKKSNISAKESDIVTTCHSYLESNRKSEYSKFLLRGNFSYNAKA